MSIDFVVASPHDAVEFNDVYRNTTGSAGYMACNNIYNRLVLNEWYELNPFPDLATHWECLDGAKRWRFHLNQAARWQDGQPLTSHDVAYTHTHALAHGYTGGRFLTDVEHIEVLDDHTLDYHLTAPNSGFLVLIGNFIFTHILPAHLYEGTDWATNPYNYAPVGSGPFRLAEWIPGDRVVLEKVKHHWGPQPQVDRVIIKINPDRDECVRMVARGEADMFPQDTLTRDRLYLLDGATVDLDVQGHIGPGMALLDFNHTHPMWQNERVRRAVAMAISHEELSTLADPGVSQAWPHYSLSSMEWSFNPDAVAPSHDVDRANELLDEAGLARGADGVRARLRLYYLDMFFGHKPISEMVAAQLGKVGLEITVSGLPARTWDDQVSQGHDFDLIITGGSMTPEMLITRPKYTTGGRNNAAGHHNPDVDAAYDAAARAVSVVERGKHYRRLQEVFARDVEWVPLVWYGIYDARTTRFFGYSDQLGFSVPWWHWGRIRPV